jgi:peptidoglycan LD-endopeptidase LytH
MKTFVFFCFTLSVMSCSTSGPGIFRKSTPHEEYGRKLEEAGLKATALGSKWFQAAQSSMASPQTITIPFSQNGFFSSDRPDAIVFRFEARRGQLITATVGQKPAAGFRLFVEAYEVRGDAPKFLALSDSTTGTVKFEAEDDRAYLIRIQPELLASGEYSVSIIGSASIAYPISAPGKNHIKSFWGAARDGGARKHEGIDLFAARRTPIVASVNGRITAVNENRLGGKVVWLRAEDRNYTLYYAHLDTQLVSDGERVAVGDTIGLMGNTGNARTTAPHLHFGIYTMNGPVDPLPFVDPEVRLPKKIISSPEMLGKIVRTTQNMRIAGISAASALPQNTVLRVLAAAAEAYYVEDELGRRGYVAISAVQPAERPLESVTASTSIPLYASPDSSAARKTVVDAGTSLPVFGYSAGFAFVRVNGVEGFTPLPL